MTKKEYVPLQLLAELHEERPGVFPVFRCIRKVGGQLMGEVTGYSDAFGNRVSISEKVDR